MHRSSIRVLVLGDGEVGKSSIIASFVSRQFVPATTPGAIIGKVQLPPDSVPFVGDSIITTIIDTNDSDYRDLTVLEAIGANNVRGRDQITYQHNLQSTRIGSIHQGEVLGNDIDSIVLVYDLNRPETFTRMEEYWLPLIEKCGEIPVIIAGNKLDLIQRSDSSSSTMDLDLDRTILKSHRQIVSLLQRFKFVREVIMCSAKNLVNIDEIFAQSIQVVIYPLLPLYNLDDCRLSDGCKRAFHRIFRIYDCDNDGLLSNEEIDTFQNFAFRTPLTMRDFDGWKQVVCMRLVHAASDDIECESTVVRDGKCTLAGFLAIFETLISQNRLDVPWKILRIFGYDDKLELRIPESNKIQDSIVPSRLKDLQSEFAYSCGLSSTAKSFLTALFFRFHPDVNDTLSKQSMMKIFSIVSEKLPPWNPSRHAQAFSNSFSVPRVNPRVSGSPSISSLISGTSLSASGITICSLGSLSSVDTSDDSIFLTNDLIRAYNFQEWMGNWYLMSSLSESFTQTELYRLGYIADGNVYGLRNIYPITAPRKSNEYLGSDIDVHISQLPSRATRIFVFGSEGIPGRRNLVEFLCGSNVYNYLSSPTLSDDVSSLRDSKNSGIPAESCFTSVHIKNHQNNRVVEHISYLIFTEIYDPKRVNYLKEIISDDEHNKCDLVVFAFNTADVSSIEYALDLEQEYLSCDIPRIFIGLDQDNNPLEPEVLTNDVISSHCTDNDIDQPLLIPMNHLNDSSRERILVHLSLCTLKESPLKVIPHGRKKLKETRFWLCLGGLSIAASFGLYSYFCRPSFLDYETRKTRDTNRTSWLRKLLFSIKRSSFEILMKFR